MPLYISLPSQLCPPSCPPPPPPPQRWTETYVRWSPQGTYLATLHNQGVALWGGEKFERITRFNHSGVQLIDFSPCERYIDVLQIQEVTIHDRIKYPYVHPHTHAYPNCPHTHLPAHPYLPTHPHTHPHTHTPTQPPAHPQSDTHTPTCLPTHPPTYPHTHLPTHTPTCLPTHPPTYPHTYMYLTLPQTFTLMSILTPNVCTYHSTCRYLVTFSTVVDNPDNPQNIIVWDIKTGLKKRTFTKGSAEDWPILK